jgi:hypothetical protein
VSFSAALESRLAMDGSAIESLCASLSDVTDVRVQGRSDHLLIDILCIPILAVLCGADDFVAVATFARTGRIGCPAFSNFPAEFRRTIRSSVCGD